MIIVKLATAGLLGMIAVSALSQAPPMETSGGIRAAVNHGDCNLPVRSNNNGGSPGPSLHGVTATSTDIPANASAAPTKLPASEAACLMSRVTATGIGWKPPTPRLVGSKVIHSTPGT